MLLLMMIFLMIALLSLSLLQVLQMVSRVEEVFFTNESIVIQDVQLFAGGQLLATNQTREAVDVEDT